MIWEHRLTGTYPLGDPKVIVTLLIVGSTSPTCGSRARVKWRGARAARICALNFAIVLFSYTIVNLYLTRFHRFF